MDRIAVYPGSFDPITNGHLDIIRRAAKMFDKVIVLVSYNPRKKGGTFPVSERVSFIRRCVADIPNVTVDSYTGLLADYVRIAGASAIVKGLRAVSDFEYEMQMATFNKDLCHELETVFFIADAELSYISSSQVRGIASLGGNVERYVTAEVAEALKQKYQK